MRTTNKQTAEELKQFGQQWDKAIENNDALEIGKFMAEDWVIVGTDGGITSKSDFLNFIKSDDLLHNKMDFEERRVEVYENTGVVTSKGISSGTYKGEPFHFFEWSTNVYIRKDSHWLCVHTMLTPAKE